MYKMKEKYIFKHAETHRDHIAKNPVNKENNNKISFKNQEVKEKMIASFILEIHF